ncbi:Ribulose-5-phosphate 4-epimerase and related epimerases and aldolases [hydrothermal vent metagenome]|uniref:Ribulose-5-phosphate 4-epimerase and related epimerases and aldolases n=1 Tax=hydrothermal vent metagenome TaxID=652676 RepID=A0A3B0Z1G9_9ZZZZ
MKSLKLRQQLIDTALAMNASGINQGTSGNLSVRVEDGFLITPSALPYDKYQCEDIVFMKLTGECEGIRKPSSEWRFHKDIYLNRKDAGAILHAHSPSCTALACLNKKIPAFHYMVAVAGGNDIRCAPYATFGTQELSDYTLTALEKRKACLLANHGMICLDQDLPKALSLAIEVENLAQVYSQTLQIGTPILLDEYEMKRVLDKFKDYWKQA